MLRRLRSYIGCPDLKAVFKRFNYAVVGEEIVLIKTRGSESWENYFLKLTNQDKLNYGLINRALI